MMSPFAEYAPRGEPLIPDSTLWFPACENCAFWDGHGEPGARFSGICQEGARQGWRTGFAYQCPFHVLRCAGTREDTHDAHTSAHT